MIKNDERNRDSNWREELGSGEVLFVDAGEWGFGPAPVLLSRRHSSRTPVDAFAFAGSKPAGKQAGAAPQLW